MSYWQNTPEHSYKHSAVTISVTEAKEFFSLNHASMGTICSNSTGSMLRKEYRTVSMFRFIIKLVFGEPDDLRFPLSKLLRKR